MRLVSLQWAGIRLRFDAPIRPSENRRKSGCALLKEVNGPNYAASRTSTVICFPSTAKAA